MVWFRHSCEGADGGAITVVPSDGSNDWSSVVKIGTGVLEYDTAQKLHNTASILCSNGTATDQAYFNWDYPLGTAQAAISFYFRYAAVPTGASETIYDTSGSTVSQFSIRLTTAGLLELVDQDGTVQTSASAPPVNIWHRLEILANRSTGALSLNTYLDEDTTPDANLSVTHGTSATFTEDFRTFSFGSHSTSANSSSMWFDSVRMQSTTSEIGPWVTSSARVDGVMTVGNWSTTGSSAVEALRDSSDATYIESPVNPAIEQCRYKLSGLKDGSITINVRAQAGATGPVRIRTFLQQGNTNIAERVDDLTTSWQTFSYTLTGVEEQLVTDREDLYVVLEAD